MHVPVRGDERYAYDIFWTDAQQDRLGIPHSTDGEVGISWREFCAKWLVRWAPRERKAHEVGNVCEGAFDFKTWQREFLRSGK